MKITNQINNLGFNIGLLSSNIASTNLKGFQGQESDDEVKGKGNSVNYKYRMHDPRVGRFFAVDPLASKYPWYTPYSFSGNKVIAWGELEGLEEKIVILSDYYEGGKMVVERSNFKSISAFRAERNSWSRAFVDSDDAWSENSNQQYFQMMKIDGDFLFKGTLTIDLRSNKASATFTFTDNMLESVYIGPNNPEILGVAMYGIYPQDVMDAAARVHDMNYDIEDAVGFGGVISEETIEADIKLVRTAYKVLDMHSNGERDPFTKEKVSDKTALRASLVIGFFSAVLVDKAGVSIGELTEGTKDININEATRRNDFEE